MVIIKITRDAATITSRDYIFVIFFSSASRSSLINDCHCGNIAGGISKVGKILDFVHYDPNES